LFPVLDFKAAKRRASNHDVDLASIIKQNFYYYLDTSGIYELVIQRLSNENIWQKKLDGRAGLNCVRFDHVIGTGQSLEPYFIETQRFISPGSYQLVLRNDTLEQKQFFSVK
ncbi:MAG: hypothetical protein KDC53_08880, partial [Saprospiraceae bacterium]|nr:hypothetical protein [Saprospiraceae bacterium]